MVKSQLMFQIASALHELANSIETLLKEDVEKAEGVVSTSSVTPTTTASAEPKADTITLEKVRAVLAAKSKGGKQKEVKALITKHGGSKLTDLDTTCYEALLKEAEVL